MFMPPLAPELAQVPPTMAAIRPLRTGVMVKVEPMPISTAAVLVVPAGSATMALIAANGGGGATVGSVLVHLLHQSPGWTMAQWLTLGPVVGGSTRHRPSLGLLDWNQMQVLQARAISACACWRRDRRGREQVAQVASSGDASPP